VGSAKQRKANNPNAEQKRIVITGVFPLFVRPNVDFIHLFPYICERAKRVRLETKRPVFLVQLISDMPTDILSSSTYAAVYAAKRKHASRNLGRTLIDV
jgi:hypothetical protein